LASVEFRKGASSALQTAISQRSYR
jgi:hypothetical protein